MSLGAAPIISAICNANTGVTNLLKSGSILRLFSFGFVPQGQPLPYAAFQTVGGHTLNSLDTASRADNERVQIDVFTAEGAGDSAVSIINAIRSALEDTSAQSSHGVGIRTITPPQIDVDPDTRRPHAMLEVSFWTTQ